MHSTAGPAGVAPYTSPTEFAVDMVQVFQNAVTYNMPGHEVHVRAKELCEAFLGRWKHAASRQPLDDHPECVRLQLSLRIGGAANGGGTEPSSARTIIDEQDGGKGGLVGEEMTAGGGGGESFRMRDVALRRTAPPSTSMADTSTDGTGGGVVVPYSGALEGGESSSAALVAKEAEVSSLLLNSGRVGGLVYTYSFVHYARTSHQREVELEWLRTCSIRVAW